MAKDDRTHRWLKDYNNFAAVRVSNWGAGQPLDNAVCRVLAYMDEDAGQVDATAAAVAPQSNYLHARRAEYRISMAVNVPGNDGPTTGQITGWVDVTMLKVVGLDSKAEAQTDAQAQITDQVWEELINGARKQLVTPVGRTAYLVKHKVVPWNWQIPHFTDLEAHNVILRPGEALVAAVHNRSGIAHNYSATAGLAVYGQTKVSYRKIVNPR